MKARGALLVLALLLVFSCNLSGWKKADLGDFEISVPEAWQFRPIKAIDSFVGEFTARKVDLVFEYSEQGFAPNPLPTEKEYLDALWLNLWCFPEEHGQLFSVEQAEDQWKPAPVAKKAALDKYRHDSLATGKIEKSVVIFKATRPLKKGKPLPDYFAIVKYRHIVDTVTIRIPAEIKASNFRTDTNGKFVTKTFWPKKPGKGITGVFIHRSDTDLTFSMEAKDLSAANQQLALKAFKTIKFK